MSPTEAKLPARPSLLRSDRDRYRVLRTICEGPTATVLEVHDEELDERIVLKVLAERVAQDPKLILRLKDELRLARRVRHPNVARVYDLEEWDDRLCISMEFIQGATLAETLAGAAMPWENATPLLRTIALALQSAHELGVVHRDLKPENLLIGPDGSPYLLDFGIALGPEASPETQTISGSPAYMAPERWRGVPGLPASDLYSLGVLAFVMLTGRPLFHAGSLRVLMSQHLHAPPPRLLAKQADLPAPLVSLIYRLLHKQPECRPGSAEIVSVLRGLIPLRSTAPAQNRGTVLVVEDERSVRHLLSGLLRSRGFTTLEAKDGLEGIEIARARVPDLILLDISMPGMDGVQTLEALKSDPKTAGRPVVMLSGTLDPQHPDLTRGLGAAAFLNKPVNTDVLDLVLDRYVN